MWVLYSLTYFPENLTFFPVRLFGGGFVISNKGMIDFDDLAESKEFRQFFNIIRELTGIPVALVSPDGSRTKILFSMDTWTPLCRLIRTHPIGRKGCRDTDLLRLSQASSCRKPLRYL